MRRATGVIILSALLGAVLGGLAANLLLRRRPTARDEREARSESFPWGDFAKLAGLVASILRKTAARE